MRIIIESEEKASVTPSQAVTASAPSQNVEVISAGPPRVPFHTTTAAAPALTPISGELDVMDAGEPPPDLVEALKNTPSPSSQILAKASDAGSAPANNR